MFFSYRLYIYIMYIHGDTDKADHVYQGIKPQAL